MKARRRIHRPVAIAPKSIQEQAFALGEKCGNAAHKRDHNTADMWIKDFRYLCTGNPEKRHELQDEFDKGHRVGMGADPVKVSGGNWNYAR